MRGVAITFCLALLVVGTADIAWAEAPSPRNIAAPAFDADTALVRTGCCAPADACCPPRCMAREYPCGSCCWKTELALQGWTFGLTGDLTVGTRTAAVEASPADSIDAIIEHGDRMFQGSIMLSRGPWSFRLQGITVRLGDTIDGEDAADGRSLGVTMGLDMAQADVAYCLKRCPTGGTCGCPGSIAYEVYAGLRYFYLETQLDFAGPAAAGTVRGTESFVDPLVGGRVTWDLGNRWSLDLEADIGGFGVGSDFSWQVRAGAEYRFARWFALEGGMRALDIDYTSGSGADRFTWDATMWGPYLSFNFIF
ncbi:MAG: hypothetical protein O2894_04130 [Planctomycetota bacterium]|nr:hypothetical protein [Planctomycetota bacterium]